MEYEEFYNLAQDAFSNKATSLDEHAFIKSFCPNVDRYPTLNPLDDLVYYFPKDDIELTVGNLDLLIADKTRYLYRNEGEAIVWDIPNTTYRIILNYMFDHPWTSIELFDFFR